MAFTIERLAPDQTTVGALAELLIETVATGGSVSFVHPLPRPEAEAFWAGFLAAPDNLVFGAREHGQLIATVTLHLVAWPNQPHHAEILKLMTRVAHRGRGAARALMLEAEAAARERARTLLTLDTAEDDGAGGFYEALGYERAGRIPHYALKPHGGLTATVIYFKRLNTPVSDAAPAPLAGRGT
jgi:ribosomal protein S18 acetylase RimI-like enzyme